MQIEAVETLRQEIMSLTAELEKAKEEIERLNKFLSIREEHDRIANANLVQAHHENAELKRKIDDLKLQLHAIHEATDKDDWRFWIEQALARDKPPQEEEKG